MCKPDETSVPVWEKTILSIKEAAELSGLGERRIKTLINTVECDFLIWVGRERYIKRLKFVEFLNNAYSV